MVLKDKNGKEIPDESVVRGTCRGIGPYWWNFWLDDLHPEAGYTMTASQYGYLHNLNQEDMNDMELIGPVKDNMHLLEYD